LQSVRGLAGRLFTVVSVFASQAGSGSGTGSSSVSRCDSGRGYDGARPLNAGSAARPEAAAAAAGDIYDRGDYV